MSGANTTSLSVIAGALDRLARKWEATPARLELSRPEREWCAQIMADALNVPLVGFGRTPRVALEDLAGAIEAHDWRRVKR